MRPAQHRAAPSGAINLDHLIANWRAYDTGSITRHSEIGEATYLRADLTGAYNSTFYTTPDNVPKVDLVTRELVFWRPDLVIVADRVVTTDTAYTPLTALHFERSHSLRACSTGRSRAAARSICRICCPTAA